MPLLNFPIYYFLVNLNSEPLSAFRDSLELFVFSSIVSLPLNELSCANAPGTLLWIAYRQYGLNPLLAVEKQKVKLDDDL